MHEMSIAVSIVGTLKDEMTLHPGTVLKKIRLGIGEFSGVEVESLKFSLDAALAEENWSGVEVEISKVPLRGACKQCGNEFELEPADFRCPACGSGEFAIEAGQSVTIDSIVVE